MPIQINTSSALADAAQVDALAYELAVAFDVCDCKRRWSIFL